MSEPSIRIWHDGPLSKDVRRRLERLRALPDVVHVAVMPDVHLSGATCVGGVIATRRLIYPDLVGQDIGCGMAAVRLRGPEIDSVLPERGEAVLRTLGEAAPIMRQPASRVVDTDDALLVTTSEHAQRVKGVVDALKVSIVLME